MSGKKIGIIFGLAVACAVVGYFIATFIGAFIAAAIGGAIGAAIVFAIKGDDAKTSEPVAAEAPKTQSPEEVYGEIEAQLLSLLQFILFKK